MISFKYNNIEYHSNKSIYYTCTYMIYKYISLLLNHRKGNKNVRKQSIKPLPNTFLPNPLIKTNIRLMNYQDLSIHK